MAVYPFSFSMFQTKAFLDGFKNKTEYMNFCRRSPVSLRSLLLLRKDIVSLMLKFRKVLRTASGNCYWNHIRTFTTGFYLIFGTVKIATLFY